MAGLHPARDEGRVNGLLRPGRARPLRVRFARPHPVSLIVVGLGVYAVALGFPLLLRQWNMAVVAAAVLGTALLILGLHVRWTRASDATR